MNKAQARPELAPQLRHARELELGRDMRRVPLKHVAVVLIVAVVVAAVFDSEGWYEWAKSLPTGYVGDNILKAIAKWHELMDSLGVTELRRVVREAFRAFQGL